LPALKLPPEREAEVVEELAQLLADASADTGLDLDSPSQVDAFLHREVPAWHELGRAVGLNRHSDHRDPSQEERTVHRITGLWNDCRQAGRLLAQRPGFTVVAVLATGLGIGLASAIFSLVDYALLRPLPVDRPGELVNTYSSIPDGFLPEEPMAYPDLVDLRETSDTFDAVAAWSMTLVALEHGGEEARLDMGNPVTGNFFQTLGQQPAAGRLLTEQDDQRGAPHPAFAKVLWSWRKCASPWSSWSVRDWRPAACSTPRTSIWASIPRG
jgi:hypothetical protein